MTDYRVCASSMLAAAQKYELCGAELVHVVDLDEAVHEASRNFSSIREIVEMPDCCFQFDCCVCSELGVSRVVLNTSVLNDLEFVAFVSRRIDTGGGL